MEDIGIGIILPAYIYRQTYTHSTNTYKVTSMLTNIYAPADSLSFVNRRDSYLCIPGDSPFQFQNAFLILAGRLPLP